jgi:tetratricopeptide (TPR) repeat protein
MNLNKALNNYIADPKNPLYNFTLGKVYEDEGHTAGAATFYMRTAEFNHEDLLAYESLLRLALCFERQGSRTFTTKGLLLRAMSFMPERPEAYFLLSRMYENCKDWQEGYTIAVLGEKLDEPTEKLITNVEYPGKYGFTFERAVTAWWLGLWDESISLCRQLIKNPNMEYKYAIATKNNIINLSGMVDWKAPLAYTAPLYEHLKIKFPGSIDIEQNYSQCYQDMFVLTMLNGKRGGKFLEIGCAGPYFGNNTALLEKNFEWTGISIDIDQNAINEFSAVRTSKTICIDATKLDYNKLLYGEKVYDYLQLDCDPALITYTVLLKIPFETIKFAVITFEHDHFADENSEIRDKSRKYLKSMGYELVVNNIAPDKYSSYEDWWVHPDLVDKYLIDKMKCISDKPKKADDYMLNRI